MPAPIVLQIPEAKRKVWAQFSAAFVEKAVAKDADKMRATLAVLLKHCADDAGVEVLRRLCDGEPADVATTILAYLPADARAKISKYLKDNPDARRAVLELIRGEQVAVREGVREVCRENPGRYPELRKVAS